MLSQTHSHMYLYCNFIRLMIKREFAGESLDSLSFIFAKIIRSDLFIGQSQPKDPFEGLICITAKQ